MKPDWRNAPVEATHCAVDNKGRWCWFRNEPVYRFGYWLDLWGGYMTTGCWYEGSDGSLESAMERRP